MNKSIRNYLLLLFTSLVKVVLVAGLILALGWTLVQGAKWKTRKPVVEAEANGTLVLLADAATINGTGPAHTESLAGKRNIGWWHDTQQWLSWRVNVARTGSYRVMLEYSLPDGQQTDFDIEIAGRKLNATAPATGSWSTWEKLKVGEIELAEGKGQTLDLKPTRISGGEGVMNFVSLHLELQTVQPEQPDAQ